jgi:two-component system response regulator YesN
MAGYGLIIIDDEEMMRDGLSSFVNWEEQGFHLDGIFEDGREAMEWLGENDTHIILTDLRMTHNSGLDVAAFVREKGLNIKIVIISGYSDFEAAREAMGYRVSDYLLKPISVKKVKETFRRLKEELDRETNSRTLISSEIERYDSLVNYVEERFISNLVLGGLRRPEELKEQLRLINWDSSILNRPCILFSLTMIPDRNGKFQSEYDSNERNSLIGGMISRHYPPPRFYWYRTSQNNLGGILFNCGELDGLKERVWSYLEKISNRAKALSVNFQVSQVRPYENLEALAQNREIHVINGGNTENRKELDEIQRQILSHILEDQEILAQEMLTSYMETLNEMGWDRLINGLVELFSQINHTFNKKKKEATDLVSFADFFSLKKRAQVYDWTREKLSEVTCFVQKDAASNQLSLITRAREYVEANYTNDIMLTQVAEHVNLSSVYLSRLFKEQGGMNFSDFLVQCRINRACELLKETSYKIYEICEEVGYTDVKHFYGVFKKKMHCTPSEYRHGR